MLKKNLSLMWINYAKGPISLEGIPKEEIDSAFIHSK